MNIQEMANAAQYRLPVKIFILNNEYMGMVRQWQELLHGSRYSESYSEALPDFVKLAEAFGVRRHAGDARPPNSMTAIREMMAHRRPGDRRMRVTKDENCFPMIPSGAAHNEMILARRPGRRGVGRGDRRGQGPGLATSRTRLTAPGGGIELRPPRLHLHARPDRRMIMSDPARPPSQRHHRRARRERGGHPGPRRRPVLRPRLQHREPDGGARSMRAARLSRITIVTSGTDMVIEQIKAQLDRLVPVHKVTDLTAAKGRMSSAKWR